MKPRIYPPEREFFQDPVSGVRVQRLTSWKAHSHHFYFTNSGWWDSDRKLLFSSDRAGRTNLYSIELDSGLITQLTYLERDAYLLHGCVNPSKPEAYFDDERSLMAVNLLSGEVRVLWEKPPGWSTSMLNCTADGSRICMGMYEKLPEFSNESLWSGYVGFRELFEAKPLSRILSFSTMDGSSQVVHEDRVWIGHVNTSPTQSHLLTFCHEGPWKEVDNRIWGLNLETGTHWPIRPRRETREAIGHEYWHADGIHLGFHGHRENGSKFFGRIRYDNEDCLEVTFPHLTGHIHSNDFHLIAGDGGSVIRLWEWNSERSSFEGPRTLCQHNSSMAVQQAHPHPRFHANGQELVFTSDSGGYCQVYYVHLPAYADLPRTKD